MKARSLPLTASLRHLASAITALFGATAAQAAPLYWDLNQGTANTAVSVGGNWDGANIFWNDDASGGAGGTPTAVTSNASDLVFSSGSLYTAGTVTLAAGRAANSVTFEDNIAVTLSSGGLTLGGGGSNPGIYVLAGDNATNTVSSPIVLAAGSSFQTLGNGTLGITGGVTGAYNLAVNSSGLLSTVNLGTTAVNNGGTVSFSGSSYGLSQISTTVGANVTGITQSSNTAGLKLGAAITVNPGGTTFTKSGAQILYVYNTGISGTGNVTFNNNSAYANPNGLDIYGQAGGAVVNNGGTITNSGTGVGGTRIVAQIGANVTSVTQNSATSNLYLINAAITPGNGNGANLSNVYSGPTNINAGILYAGLTYTVTGSSPPASTGLTAALASTGSINFGGGTLMYGAPSTTDLSAKFSTTGASPFSLDTNGQTITLAGSGLTTASSKGLNKFGPGTLTLSGANAYTGTTTIGGGTGTLERHGGGTLNVTGSLNGTTGTALTFGGTGTLIVSEATGVSQGMGALTLSAGDGTVQSTNNGGSSFLTFTSLASRAAGATANFEVINGTNGLDNKIALTNAANVPLNNAGSNNQGFFFGGTDYARYDTASGTFKAVAYGTDTNAPAAIGGGATLGVNDATKDTKITGSISAQTTASVNTLNIGANNVTLATGATLSLNGIVKGGSSTSTISGGGGLTAASSGNELVFRTDVAASVLTISTPILANGTNALTKSGAGILKLSGANTYTGNTAINQGTLILDTPADRTYGGVISGAGALTVQGPGILTLNGAASNFTGDLTIAAGGTLKLDFSGGASPSADMINGVHRVVFGSGGSPTNVSGGGTLLIKAKSAGITTQNLGMNLASVVAAGINNQPGSSRLLVDTNGGTETQILMGKIGNVLANNDTTTTQNVATNGSGLLIGKTAGAVGTATFLYNTDGRNGPSNGTFLCGRLVYTDNGGSNVDFVTTTQQESGVYSIVPIGTGGFTYNNIAATGSSGYIRFTNSMSSLNVTSIGGVSGFKIENPGSGKSINITAGQNFNPQGGIIMTGSDDFSILGGNMQSNNNGNGRSYIYNQYSTGTLTVSSAHNTTNAGTHLVKLGPGRLILSGANTYPGNTYISEGILQAGIAQNGITNGPFGTASGAGSLVFAGGTLQYSAANQHDYSPRFRTGDGEPIKIDTNGQTVSFGTALTSAGGTLTLNDTAAFKGSLTLTNANTYTGNTTIQGGTLKLGATGSIANSARIIVGDTLGSTAVLDVSGKAGGLTVGSSQVLQGSGSIIGGSNPLTVSGILAPGNSIESLALEGNLVMNNGSTFAYEYNSGAGVLAGVAGDLMTVRGSILSATLGDVTLTGTVNLGLADLAGTPGAFAVNTTLSLINYAGTLSGGFFYGGSLLTDGSQITLGANTWTIRYGASSGGLNFFGDYLAGGKFINLTNSSNITAVPEPGSLLALGCLVGSGVLLRSRRRS